MRTADRKPLWVMPGWILSISALLFLALSLITIGEYEVPGDEPVIDAIQQLDGQPWRAIADVGNLIGDTPASPIVLTVLLIFSVLAGSRSATIFCVLMMLFRLSGWFFKEFFDSPRPTVRYAEIREPFDGLGYPSGHAMTSMVIAKSVAVVLLHLYPRSPWVKWVVGTIWVWTVLCGYARIWYGAHWPSDVLGGYLSATVMIGLSTWFVYLIERYRPTT